MEHQLDINGKSFFVRDEGTGPVLVLVHGFPLDHTMWKQQISGLSDCCRVLAIDLRGFGQSTGPVDGLTMKDFADDVAEILVALDIEEPVTFCGLSMGGYVAWQFWEHHRDQLAKLILCDTKAVADDAAGKENREQVAQRVLKYGMDFLGAFMSGKLFAKRTQSERHHIVEQTTKVIRESSAKTVAAASRAMANRPDFTDRLADIDVPTLVIVGEEDSISTVAEMQSIANALPHATIEVIPDAGHMAPLEAPGPTNTAIRAFLKL